MQDIFADHFFFLPSGSHADTEKELNVFPPPTKKEKCHVDGPSKPEG